MTTVELAQKILDMMQEAHDDVWSKPINETYEGDRQAALLEDIEALCKEQVEVKP